jgi:hypothetical protein
MKYKYETFCRNGKHRQKVRTTAKPSKKNDSGKEKVLKQNKIGYFKIKNYKFRRVANFKYLGVTLNDDTNH